MGKSGFRNGQSAYVSGSTRANREVGANRGRRGRCSRQSCMCCARAASGRRCPANSPALWRRGCPSTMRWRVLLGDGKASTGHYWRHRRHGSQSGPGPPTDEKSEGRRTPSVDARGVPLSIVVIGGNRHDVIQSVATVDASLGLPLHYAPPALVRRRRVCWFCGRARQRSIAPAPLMSGQARRTHSTQAPVAAKRGHRGWRGRGGQSLKTNDEIARSDRADKKMDFGGASAMKACKATTNGLLSCRSGPRRRR